MDDDVELLVAKEPAQWKNTRIGLFQFWSATSLTILSYLQIHALINSLALNWTFPENYTQKSSFLFIFNLDIWELAKVNSGYVAQSSRPTPSKDVMSDGFHKWYFSFVAIHWGLLALFIIGVFIGNKNVKRKKSILPPIRVAGLVVWSVFVVPVGVNYSKVFWCLPWSAQMDVSNEITCWTNGESKAYFIVSILSMAVHFLVIPVYLTMQIRENLITTRVRTHEGYLLRRELEFDFGINGKFFSEKIYLFSLFRRRHAYFIVTDALFKIVLIIFYCAFFSLRDNPQATNTFSELGKLISSSGIFITVLLKFLIDLCAWPFRPILLNVLHWICLLTLCGIGVIGLLLNVPDLENALVTPNYVNGELIAIDVGWFVLLCLWVTFALVKHFRRRVWPSLYSKEKKAYLAGQNDRYVDALKEAAEVITRCQKCVPLFAPAHELKAQILKINALTREAEYYNELLHPTLQDALQMLTETYAEVSKISIFSSVASNMKSNRTAEDLTSLVPDFAVALEKRDFDLALSRRHCKRALLKISAMAAFAKAGEKKSFESEVTALDETMDA